MENENNKNVLAILKQMVADGQIAQDVAEKYFPELAESEDERIRKALIFDYQGDGCMCTNEYRIDFKDIRAWLEKQGESYTKRDVDDAYLKGVTNTKNEIEKQYEANYQIRKDIATFIFNYKGDIKDRAKWMNYLGIKVSFVEKQGEQKTVKFIPERKLRKDLYQLVYDCAWSKVTCKVEGETQEEYAERYTQQILDVIRDWADDYIDNSIERQLRRSYDKGREEVLNEQKSAWSEEDETKIKSIVALLKSPALCAMDGNKGIIDENIKYLKSIKYRVQPKKEWSEDDMEKISWILAALQNSTMRNSSLKKENEDAENWLKSLRPQNAWKPSDEQMLAINTAVNVIGKGTLTGKGLIEIQEQLKKLIC